MRDQYKEAKRDIFYMLAAAFYIIATFVAIAGVLIGLIISAPNARSAERVDVALILANDHSDSITPLEWRLQMEGYAEAFESEAVKAQIMAGARQRIAVYLFRWASDYAQYDMVPWRIVDSPAAADALAAEIRAQANLKNLSGTCISGAMVYASDLFAKMPFEATSWVLDVSGDESGNCSHHPYWPAKVRDELVKQGITINGLPILETRSPESNAQINENADLQRFYKDNVIGGMGAFIEPSIGFEDFGRAMQRKLLREIASLSPIKEWRP
jgi:hypothetical protein